MNYLSTVPLAVIIIPLNFNMIKAKLCEMVHEVCMNVCHFFVLFFLAICKIGLNGLKLQPFLTVFLSGLFPLHYTLFSHSYPLPRSSFIRFELFFEWKVKLPGSHVWGPRHASGTVSWRHRRSLPSPRWTHSSS